MDSIRIARVTAVHRQAHAVDIILANDGARYAMVQVMAMAGSDWGRIDLPDVVRPKAVGDYMEGLGYEGGREMCAVVAFFYDKPVVLGFLLPPLGMMTFADKNRRVDRHASGVYSTIDGAGNLEVHHPSGTFLRMATSPAHEDLSGRDFDKRWSVPAADPVHVHLEVQSGGAAKVTIDLAPDGSVTVNAAGTVSVTAGGAATLTAPSVTLDTPTTHCTGAVTVDGLLTYKAGLSGTGGGAGTTITGTITQSGGTLSSNGIVLDSHHHSGVQPGAGNSGLPA